jgi:hypothetical protein
VDDVIGSREEKNPATDNLPDAQDFVHRTFSTGRTEAPREDLAEIPGGWNHPGGIPPHPVHGDPKTPETPGDSEGPMVQVKDQNGRR